MENSTKVVIGIFAILIIAVLAMGAKGSELSDYRYLTANQDSPRNVALLNDMAYHYGGMDKLNVKMSNMENVPVVHTNGYFGWNPVTTNVEFTGTWYTSD